MIHYKLPLIKYSAFASPFATQRHHSRVEKHGANRAERKMKNKQPASD